MDNLKKPNKRPAGSIDGFISSGSRQSKTPSSLNAFNQYYKGQHNQLVDDNASIGRVDDFKSPDGFQTFEQAPIYRPADANKPAELSSIRQQTGEPVDSPKVKRRWFKSKSAKSAARRQHNAARKHRKLRFSLKTAGVLVSLAVLVGGGLALKAYFKLDNVLKGGSNGAVALNKNVDPTLLKGEGDGRVNILLLGKGGEGHSGPDLTDTLMLASIDPIAKEAALLSIPRDFWVKSAASGYQSKINEVYANAKYAVLNSYTVKQQTAEVKEKAEQAGIKAIQETITNVIGIPIQYYVMVDFAAFRQAIDAVGGVDVNVKEQLYDPSVAWENNNNPVIAKVGLQHFDGKKALLYSRSRNGSARGDFDRAERQREIISALKEKVFSAGTFANPLKLNQLINAFGDHVSTDFSVDEMMRVYEITKQITSDKIVSIGLDDYVHGEAMRGLSAQVPKAGTFNYSAIQNYVRNVLRDSFLKSENASIIILNGTNTAGLATLKSTELKSFGYNVTQVGDAPTKTYTRTTLIDLSKGKKKYTRTYLEKRLNVTATANLPDANITPGTADFVIILGTNEPTSSN